MGYNFILCGTEKPDDIIDAAFSMHGGFQRLAECKADLTSENLLAAKNNLLIIDCQGYDTGEAYGDIIGTIKNVLENDQPILLYKPESFHKKMLMEADILAVCIENPALACCLIPQRDEEGNLYIKTLEYCGIMDTEAVCQRDLMRMDAGDEFSIVKSDEFQIKPGGNLTISELEPFINTIRESMHVLKKEGRIAYTALENQPPGNIPKTLWFKDPINLYVTCRPVGSSGESGFTPPTGSIVLEMGIDVGAYYDNANYSTPVQMINIVSKGHTTVTMCDNNADKRGWSLSAVEIDGTNISSSEVVSVASSPNNVSNQVQYTAGNEFSVGVEAGTEDMAASASYTISNSITKNILEWDIVQKDPNTWVFKQRIPYDGTTLDFPKGAAGNDGVTDLPEISKTSLYLDTNTLWRKTPASKSTLSLQYAFKIFARYTWADKHDSTSYHAWSWYYRQTDYKYISVNLGRAYPTKS